MADSEIEINGGIVVYEWVGPEDGEAVVLTSGGRFSQGSKDCGGVHELADALAEGGKRVLLWDRPGTGRSDVQFFGPSELHMHAETLGLLLKEIGVDSVTAIGGSGGSLDTIRFALMWPELVNKVAVWSVIGGPISAIVGANWAYINDLRVVRSNGIEGVMEMTAPTGGWASLIEANPRNRERMLALGSEGFERLMHRWLDPLIPKPNEVLPGVARFELLEMDIPTMIIRPGETDTMDHPLATSMELHALIKGSRLIDPPWPEDAWEKAQEAFFAGRGSVFDPWVLAAPVLLDFMNDTL